MAKAPVKLSSPDNNRSDNLAGGVAGASIGSVIAAMVNHLPDDNEAKSWLIILLPIFSVILTWISKQVIILAKKAKLRKLKVKFRNQITIALQNPNLTDNQKNEIQQLTYNMDKSDLEILSTKIKSISNDVL